MDLELKLWPWENGVKPYFEHGDFKWYVDKDVQRWINSGEKLENVYAFLVKHNDEIDRVLINDKQQVLFKHKGLEDICSHIDIMKLDQQFNKHEKENH